MKLIGGIPCASPPSSAPDVLSENLLLPGPRTAGAPALEWPASGPPQPSHLSPLSSKLSFKPTGIYKSPEASFAFSNHGGTGNIKGRKSVLIYQVILVAEVLTEKVFLRESGLPVG